MAVAAVPMLLQWRLGCSQGPASFWGSGDDPLPTSGVRVAGNYRLPLSGARAAGVCRGEVVVSRLERRIVLAASTLHAAAASDSSSSWSRLCICISLDSRNTWTPRCRPHSGCRGKDALNTIYSHGRAHTSTNYNTTLAQISPRQPDASLSLFSATPDMLPVLYVLS